jgi:hypothetical protein
VLDIWLGWTNEPNHAEDVTGMFATKIAALTKHGANSEGIRFLEEFLERSPSKPERGSASSTPRSSASWTLS